MDLTSLEQEIEQARKTVHVDSYPMSIGELVNLYRDGDLRIQPEFQRIFRWKEWQKSQFIESILLGIPIPSIFVAQQSDGKWDVVDGLQRISTILQFLGLLTDEEGKLIPPLELEATKYLKNLKGKVCADRIYSAPSEIVYEERLIHPNIIRAFKREKIDLKIIKKESNQDAKLELFQRLNTGGSKLSPQEVRNCLLLMVNKQAFEWLQTLSKNQDFQETLSISTNKEEQSYANELLLKYFALRYFDVSEIEQFRDVHPYLDEAAQRIFKPESNFNYEEEQIVFEKTFAVLNNTLGDKAFKKYNPTKDEFQGAFSTPIYECLTSAVSNYIALNLEAFNAIEFSEKLTQQAKALVIDSAFTTAEKERPINKTQKMHELSLELFNNADK